jgi:hypothetical protein
MSHSLTTTLIVNPAPAAPGHVAVLRDWAFCAGFRLCDESKPILLRLAVEAMIAGHALMLWVQRSAPRDGRNRRTVRKPSRRRQSRVTIERRAGISAPCAFSGHTLPPLPLESHHAPRPAAIGHH